MIEPLSDAELAFGRRRGLVKTPEAVAQIYRRAMDRFAEVAANPAATEDQVSKAAFWMEIRVAGLLEWCDPDKIARC